MTTVMDTGARLFVGGQFRKADQVETVMEAATGEPLGAVRPQRNPRSTAQSLPLARPFPPIRP
jgi:hypothetical protein